MVMGGIYANETYPITGNEHDHEPTHYSGLKDEKKFIKIFSTRDMTQWLAEN